MYIFLDSEFGGLDTEKYSLLTVYLMATDDNFKVIGDLYLYLKPEDGIYKVCAEAMNVNKINLVEHDKKAITYKQGGTKLYDWLNQVTETGKTRAIVVGHGIHGDVDWIIKHLISRANWEKFTSYRKLCTSSTCQFLRACGLFPEEVSGSLGSLVEYFKIPMDKDKLHDAKVDTEHTYQVFLELRKMLKKLQDDAYCDECSRRDTEDADAWDGYRNSMEMSGF